MKSFLTASSSLALAAVLLATGCYSPQPTTIYGTADLPKEDWYTLSEKSDLVQSLNPAWQAALAEQRAAVATEIAAKGEISSDTRKRINDLNESCNSVYLVSFNTIATQPTPGLNGFAETYDLRRENDVMIYNQNLRALSDEWSRFWLVDQPGGTPYNTINTTGRF